MLNTIPCEEEMTALVGQSLYEVWSQLCAVIIILGKDERAKFETDRENYSEDVQKMYDGARTYHDGKGIMFEPVDTSLFPDFIRLLSIKRKPNRK